MRTRIAGSSRAQVFFVSRYVRQRQEHNRAEIKRTFVEVYVAISKSNFQLAFLDRERRQTYTRLGARHRYVNCHAASSKSYDSRPAFLSKLQE